MPETLAEALLEVQKNAPSLQKDAINPHFGNSYISLQSLTEQILPILNENELVLIQSPSHVGDGPNGPVGALTTQIIHVPTGQTLADTMLLMGKTDPQGQGSAITYARRYALMSILGLVADEDDDGERATRGGGRVVERATTKEGRPKGGF
jgi:ERF superfamily